MNPNENNHHLEKYFTRLKNTFEIKDPQLGFSSSVTLRGNPDKPDFDPQFMSLNKYAGDWTDLQITHLLRRTKFGFTKKDLDFFRSLDLDQSIDLLLTPEQDPPLPVNDYNEDDFVDPDVPWGESWLNAPHNGDYEGGRIMSLKRWWMNNIINQGHSITEKMLLFWHNHLVTEWWGVFVAKASYNYIQTLRKYHLGNFKTLMKEITLDISMLLYLNNAQSQKAAPDENYARELQELFCIGKGPNSKYTEDDVRAAARVLTGWSIDNWPPNRSEFQVWRHDTGDKQFSEFYGNKIIKGKSGEQGAEELDELLDMIFENEETALFMCRKFYKFFVYPEISDEVEEKIIIPLAEIFRNNGYEVKPVIETLLFSEHFYDINVKGAIIQDPVQHLLTIWKNFNPPLPPDMNEFQKVGLKSSMFWSMHNNGMQLGDPPSVAGWQAYYQAPIYDKGWITTNTILSRAINSDSLIYWGFWSPSHQVPADLVAFSESLDHPEDPNAWIDQVALLFLGVEVSDQVKQSLKSILLSNQAEDYYWTIAWNTFQQNPTPSNRQIIENRLKWTMQRVLQLAESHLM